MKQKPIFERYNDLKALNDRGEMPLSIYRLQYNRSISNAYNVFRAGKMLGLITVSHIGDMAKYTFKDVNFSFESRFKSAIKTIALGGNSNFKVDKQTGAGITEDEAVEFLKKLGYKLYKYTEI